MDLRKPEHVLGDRIQDPAVHGLPGPLWQHGRRKHPTLLGVEHLQSSIVREATLPNHVLPLHGVCIGRSFFKAPCPTIRRGNAGKNPQMAVGVLREASNICGAESLRIPAVFHVRREPVHLANQRAQPGSGDGIPQVQPVFVPGYRPNAPAMSRGHQPAEMARGIGDPERHLVKGTEHAPFAGGKVPVLITSNPLSSSTVRRRVSRSNTKSSSLKTRTQRMKRYSPGPSPPLPTTLPPGKSGDATTN